LSSSSSGLLREGRVTWRGSVSTSTIISYHCSNVTVGSLDNLKQNKTRQYQLLISFSIDWKWYDWIWSVQFEFDFLFIHTHTHTHTNLSFHKRIFCGASQVNAYCVNE
jgi:hypothetical protein